MQTLLFPSINAQPETLFLVRILQHDPCHTRIPCELTRVCHLNSQISLGRTPRYRANLFNPISSRFDGCCNLRARSRHSTCISGLSLERYCARIVFARHRFVASLPSGVSPSMSSSLSLTAGVETDRPVTPNDFLMRAACRGSVSQEPHQSIPQSFPSTRMLCTQSWYPEGPRRLVTNPELVQFHKKKNNT